MCSTGWVLGVKALCGATCDVNSRTEKGFTPAMIAVQMGFWQVIRELIRAGANLRLLQPFTRYTLLDLCDIYAAKAMKKAEKKRNAAKRREYSDRFSKTASLLLALDPDWIGLKEWRPRAAVGRHAAASGNALEEDTEAGLDSAADRLRGLSAHAHSEEAIHHLELRGAFQRCVTRRGLCAACFGTCSASGVSDPTVRASATSTWSRRESTTRTSTCA